MATQAQYLGTGKRKTSVARVIFAPATARRGSTARRSRSTSRAAPSRRGDRAAEDGRASRASTTFGCACTAAGRSGQAGAIRHGIARALVEVNPELRVPLKRAGLPDARRTQRRAQEGRPAQGPQGAAVLEALASPLVVARRYFGTDGVRGVVGEFLTPELVERLGRAAALWSGAAKVFVGRDTRASGVELEEAFARGVVSAGGDCVLARRAADAGGGAARARSRRRHLRVAQPARVQRRQVLRLAGPQALRRSPRSRSRRCSQLPPAIDAGRGRARRGRDRLVPRARPRALRLGSDRAAHRRRLRERRVLRASRRARSSGCGAEVHAIGDAPDGTNINVGCGATDTRAAAADGARRRLRPRHRVRRRRRPDARRRRAGRAGRRRPDRRDPRARPRRRRWSR